LKKLLEGWKVETEKGERRKKTEVCMVLYGTIPYHTLSDT